MSEKVRVGIVGAGFAGISAAKVLASSKKVDVHLIDRRNYHLFQPLLYQVAMAGLNPSDIAMPIRSQFSGRANVHVTMAEVEEVDVSGCRLKFDAKWHSYDYLIVACGSKHSYFGKNEWEQFAPGLKNIEQATEIRRRILISFEIAEKTKGSDQQAYLNFVVVGGGPTGVELAGAISEMAKTTLIKDFRSADLSKTRVYLVEAGPRILAAFPESLSARVESDLIDMGVTVLKNTRASELSSDGLRVGESWIASKTIIWAAGVSPSGAADTMEVKRHKSGRLIVSPDLSFAENKNVFACGDIVHFESDGKQVPGIAPAAIQQGDFAAKAILNDIQKKPRSEFRYWDKGMMATVGRSRAVVSSGSLQMTGFLAWAAWVFIHIIYILQFRNRVFVFFQWVWSYFSFGRGARLIVHKSWKFYDGNKMSYLNSDLSEAEGSKNST